MTDPALMAEESFQLDIYRIWGRIGGTRDAIPVTSLDLPEVSLGGVLWGG